MPPSRVQLAAALLEYDNDPTDPSRPLVDHRRSALFLHSQRPPTLPGPGPGASPPRLTVPVPIRSISESGAGHGAEYPLDEEEGHAGEDGVAFPQSRPSTDIDMAEIDLSRWGIPSHLLSPDNTPNTQSQPATTVPFPTGRPASVPLTFDQSDQDQTAAPGARARTRSALVVPSQPLVSPASPVGARAVSIHFDVLPSEQRGDGLEHEDEEIMQDYQQRSRLGTREREVRDRRASADLYGAQAALVRAEHARRMAQRPATVVGMPSNRSRRISAASMTPTMVPFPDSPAGYSYARPMSSLSQGMSYFDDQRPSAETLEQLGDEDIEHSPEKNPFALPPPPVQLGSRFDPKVMDRQRKDSGTSSRSANTLALARPSVERRASAPLTEGQLRRHSRALSGVWAEDEDEDDDGDGDEKFVKVDRPSEIRVYDDIPTAEEYGRPLRPPKYGPLRMPDRMSLLRPKTLVMPSPLTGAEQSLPMRYVPEGWELGEKPLPRGARSSMLTLQSGEIRPGMAMSLSQRTFRDSMLVGGARGEVWIGGADQEGEIGFRGGEADERAMEKAEKRPGKLYGTSLMDQLEARKQALKSKQRVFYGDSRPAMMARESSRRSTLIDPTSLASQPGSPEKNPGAGAPRPASMMPMSSPRRAPLLQFDDNEELHPHDPAAEVGPTGNPRMIKSKSVFGVDQIWEREMAKLRAMEEEEARAKAEQAENERLRIEAAEAKMRKKEQRKSKGKSRIMEPALASPERGFPQGSYGDLAGEAGGAGSVGAISPIRVVPDLPPTLHYSPERANTPEVDLGRSPRVATLPRLTTRGAAQGDWSDSSDEEDSSPRRRHSGKGKAKAKGQSNPQAVATAQLAPLAVAESEDSEEDVPLSRLPRRNAGTSVPAVNLIPHVNSEEQAESDSDEDVPLSKLAIKSPLRGVSPAMAPATAASGPGSVSRPGLAAGSLGLSLATSSPMSITPVTASPCLTPSPIGPGDTAGVVTPNENDQNAITNIHDIEPAKRVGSTEIPVGKGNGNARDDDDDDDVPLMMRRARAQTAASLEGQLRRPTPAVEEAEDDLPLGYKHAEAAYRQARASGMDGAMDMGMGVGYGGMGTDPRGTMMSFAPSGYGGHGQRQGFSPLMGMGGMPMGMPVHGMPGMPGIPGMGGPYAAAGRFPSVASLHSMAMGYPGMMGGIGGMGGMGGTPGSVPPMPGFGGMGGMGGGPSAGGSFDPAMGYGLQEKAIDSWRKGVAVGPLSEAGTSGRGRG